MYIYNTCLGIFKKTAPPAPTEIQELQEIQEKAIKKTDINDHLETLYAESLRLKPQLIVELGVRGGESTFAFERAAKITNATLVSVDIDDCLKASQYEKWHFVRSDDIAFTNNFPTWCKDKGIAPLIDVLFIDTSHLYEHTKQEIEAWFPLLAKKCVVFFHDTNLQKIFFRQDKSMGIGWDNQRGVIRALEEYLGQSINEKNEFKGTINNWQIQHYPYCNGLTILKKEK